MTTHNRAIQFDDGDGKALYTPTSGFDATAEQLQAGLREQNRDVLGVISDDRFTRDHLRAGVWDHATVTVSTVDWMYALAGAMKTVHYNIGRVVYTGTQFTAELIGLTNRLRAKSGRIVARPCNADLFDTRCGLSSSTVSTWKVQAVRVDPGTQDADEPRRIFQARFSDLSTTSDDFYKYGRLVWTVGQNAKVGYVSLLKGYTDASRLIELFEPTPYDIADTDKFTLFVGCDGLFSTCRDKFDPGASGEGNTLNFRGFKDMPGTDHILRRP